VSGIHAGLHHEETRVNGKMIRFELLRDRRILLITPDGPLQRADFEQLAKEIDPFIAANGKLVGVMIHAKSFPGWESFGALVSHLKFVVDHHRQIERIAAVTDSGFLKIVPRIASHFLQASIRHFDFSEKDRPRMA
jgi:hypothetical protein